MKDKKNLLMIALLLFIVGLSYSFISYSTKSNQSSVSQEQSRWDVKITNVEIITNGEAEDIEYKYKSDTLLLKPTIKTAEDSILYRVTVKNEGTIFAKLGRYLYNEKNKDEHLIFTHNVPKEELAPGEETIVDLYVYPNKELFKEGEVYSNDYTAIYEYIQKK
jgi:hypothetical protein